MKKIYTAFILMCVVLSGLKAQYKKMPFDTMHYWHENFYRVQGSFNYYCDYQYEVDKDTIVSGRSYKKVIISGKVCNNSGPIGFYSPYASYLREDTALKRVNILDASWNEKILYNFMKNPGDTLNVYVTANFAGPASVMTFTLASIDSVMLNDGLYHRRHRYGGSTDVIEGVGGWGGFLTPYCHTGFGIGTMLNCTGRRPPVNTTIYATGSPTNACTMVITGQQEIAGQDVNVSLYPNPFSDRFTLRYDGALSYAEVYNALGEICAVPQNLSPGKIEFDMSHYASGMYFVKVKSGDKYLVQKLVKD